MPQTASLDGLATRDTQASTERHADVWPTKGGDTMRGTPQAHLAARRTCRSAPRRPFITARTRLGMGDAENDRISRT